MGTDLELAGVVPLFFEPRVTIHALSSPSGRAVERDEKEAGRKAGQTGHS